MANSIQRLKEGAETRSVLIIDDDPEIAESLSRILRVFFREYVIASDGEEALALFYERFKASNPFTLVVTDLELPKLGGLRLIREIRALSPSQPIVILSAHDEAAFMAEAIAQNVQGYLLKPLAMPKLFNTLEKVFSLEHVADAAAESTLDPITGWNLFPVLNERIAAGEESPITLMRLRVNHFNNIIAFVGEDYANEYLTELSRLLESLVYEPKGEFFRTATDEFCLLFQGEHIDYAAELAGNMASVVRYFHTSERGIILNSTLSVGIASGSGNVLLHSKRALETTNDRSGGAVSVYSPLREVDDPSITSSRDILRMIFNALVHEDIVPLFQPIVDAHTLKPAMYQSLIRIRKDGQLYGPDTFLNLAISMGQMVMITRSMIRNTLQLYPLLEKGTLVVINLSSNDLSDEGLVAYIRFWTERFGIDPSSVAFQLINGIETLYDDAPASTVSELQREGYKIILNHFGAGEFDLPLLLSLKPDYINLHPKVTEKLGSDEGIGHIIASMVEIVHLVGSKAIAKNISDAGHIALLNAARMDYIQGYAVGDPFEVTYE